MTKRVGSLVAGVVLFALAGCGEPATMPIQAGMGPKPYLPPPEQQPYPTIVVAPAVGWRAGATPIAAQGLQVSSLARGLEHPRWLYVLPNGDVLVAETNGPARPGNATGVRGWMMKRTMARAGALRTSANRITLLRDLDQDGIADLRTFFLENLNSPFGMTLVGDQLYVANTDALVRYTYPAGATAITTAPTKVVDLPAGPINHHWTRNVIASEDGTRLYVTVGSNSNVGENGLEQELQRAAILEIDAATGATRVFASGLRNPNGMAWEPVTKALWTVVNERDEIGNDLVPDYLTSVRPNAFYGWPYSYYGGYVDERVKPQNPSLVATARVPDYALGAHTASLGLTFYEATLLPEAYHGGAFIGQHGSWNRNPPSGYKVIFVPFANGKPNGAARDVLTGFLNEMGEARGRPAGVVVDREGALLVADDVGNTVWRVTPANMP
jgi:glucose/arabinose dehydrogenase